MTGSQKLFATAYFLACVLVMLLAALLPQGAGPVAVFASPYGKSAVEVIAAAGGRIVSAGDHDFVAVTMARDEDFIARLYASGAGFVASSTAAAACARWNGVSLEKAI
ncbi:hypothetical protein [Roseibium sp. M-1]